MTLRWSHLKRVPGECNVLSRFMTQVTQEPLQLRVPRKTLICITVIEDNRSHMGKFRQVHHSRNTPDLFTGTLRWGITDDVFFPATSSGNVDPPLVLSSSTKPCRESHEQDAKRNALLNVHFDTAAPREPWKCPRSLTRKRHFHPSNRPPLPPPLLTLLRSMHSARLTAPFHQTLPTFSVFHSRRDLLRAKAIVPRLPKLLYQG